VVKLAVHNDNRGALVEGEWPYDVIAAAPRLLAAPRDATPIAGLSVAQRSPTPFTSDIVAARANCRLRTA